MARTVRDASLETRTARTRLKISGKPYYRTLDPGLHLGYRKGVRGGVWVLRRYIGGQTYTVESIGTADDKADADGEAVLSFTQAQAKARGRHVERTRTDMGLSPKGGPYTVRLCLNEYLTWLEGHRKTADDARYRADALILPKLGDIECSRLTTTELQKWLRDLAASAPRMRSKKTAERPRFREIHKDDDDAQRRRRATANRTLTVLKAALNRAWRDGKIPSDDAWRRVQPFAAADAARMRYLSVAEAKRLVNASARDFRMLVQAALTTGARYGELAALLASDFNPDSGTIHVRTSKTGRGRHVVLNDEGKALFKSLATGKGGDAILLPKADGTAWTKGAQGRPMADAVKRAKISPRISFHGLRHTYASLAVMNGAPLMVVGRNLGHADTRMVEKHYGHLAPSYVADAIRAAAPNFGIKAPSNVLPARVAR